LVRPFVRWAPCGKCEKLLLQAGTDIMIFKNIFAEKFGENKLLVYAKKIDHNIVLQEERHFLLKIG
jgi:hypothetical protein